MKSSISALISSSRMALAAWSTSITMARWKWAKVTATALRRWNVSRRRTLAEAQPRCRADGRSWLRCEVCDPGYWGAPGQIATIGPLPCLETDPVAAEYWSAKVKGRSRRSNASAWTPIACK
jgi:hypothetical protein